MNLIIGLIIFQFFSMVISNRTDYYSQRNWEAVPRQVECFLYETKMVNNFTCKFKKLSRLRASYTFDGYIMPGIQFDNIFLNGTLYRKGSNLEFRVYGPRNFMFDICGFLSGSWTTIMMELIMKELKNRGNIFHSCPYSGHIYVHDFRSTENTYAFFKLLPDGEYFFQALLFVKQDGKETLILKTKLFIDILAKGLIRF